MLSSMNISNHFCHEIMSCYLKGANGLMGRVSEGLSLSWCWTGHQMPNISRRRYLDNDYLVCLEIIMS